MFTVLIAGAGNIGSRHLQGTTKSANDLDIWVYDLSEESLKVAKERFEQMPENGVKKVHYVTNLNEVPDSIDVAIVASGSKPRAAIIKQVLAAKKVQYMVLEKFLFGKLSEYTEIGELLKTKGVKTWVNCPYRMFDGYKRLKGKLDTKSPLIASFGNGGNWGLCCNAIHYIDIFMYLTGQEDFTVDLSKLEEEVLESKRPGYIELIGDLTVETPKGDALTLQTSKEGEFIQQIKINNGANTIVIDENASTVDFNGEFFQLGFTFQSGLTGRLIDDLIGKRTCDLSSFETSAHYHIQFLNAVMPFINRLKGWETDACPIT